MRRLDCGWRAWRAPALTSEPSGPSDLAREGGEGAVGEGCRAFTGDRARAHAASIHMRGARDDVSCMRRGEDGRRRKFVCVVDMGTIIEVRTWAGCGRERGSQAKF